MAKEVFNVNISPIEVNKIIKEKIRAEMVDYEECKLGNNKYITVTTFQKYYLRNNSNAALVLICDNTLGNTRVKAVGTGGGTAGLAFDFGAGDSFAAKVKELLKSYIVN